MRFMTPEQKERLARIIQDWMEKNNLTQRPAAKLLGCSQSAIASWSKGENSIQWESFERLAQLLGKTPEAFYAEVRGVAYQQLPAKLTFQDIEKLALALPWEDRARLSNSILQSFLDFVLGGDGAK